jgi:hypothetical protein
LQSSSCRGCAFKLCPALIRSPRAHAEKNNVATIILRTASGPPEQLAIGRYLEARDVWSDKIENFLAEFGVRGLDYRAKMLNGHDL